MGLICSALAVAGLVLLIALLLSQSRRYAESGALEGPEDGNHRRAPAPTAQDGEGDWRLTQPEPGPARKEAVAPLPTKGAGRSRCPACAAPITAADESCPSCGISFVADGSDDSDRWGPRAV